MYLTYAEYKAYGGTESETTFNDLEFEAASVIDWYTFGRLRNDTEFSEDVKRCDFKLISFILEKMVAEVANPDGSSSNGVAAGIASQSNDGVSASYNIMSAKDIIENSRAEMAATVNRYLAYTVNSLGQKVLFRGLYKNE